MRDDKGGEYMSNAFSKFTTQSGLGLSRMVLQRELIGCGLGQSLMYLTFESGDALLMFTSEGQERRPRFSRGKVRLLVVWT